MTEAEKKDPRAGLVEMVITGRKRMSVNDPDTGRAIMAQPGDHVFVNPSTAKTFAHCLTAPSVVDARAKATQAAEDADAEAHAATLKASADAEAGAAPKEEPKVESKPKVAIGSQGS